MCDSSPDGCCRSSWSSLWLLAEIRKKTSPERKRRRIRAILDLLDPPPAADANLPVKTVRNSQCAANKEARAGWRGIIWLPRRLHQPFISTLQSLDLALRHQDNTGEAEPV